MLQVVWTLRHRSAGWRPRADSRRSESSNAATGFYIIRRSSLAYHVSDDIIPSALIRLSLEEKASAARRCRTNAIKLINSLIALWELKQTMICFTLKLCEAHDTRL